MKTKQQLPLLWLCLLGCWLCWMVPERVHAQQAASLALHVQTAEGVALRSMGIELNNEVVRYTNQRGRFRFKPLAAGTHRLRISFPTYHPIDTLIELAPGEKKRVTLVMKAHCRQWHAEAARADLAAGRVVLLLSSGIAPKVYTTDSLFEATYQLRYYDLGCVVVDNASCMAAYNREVFAHLDALYGRAWRKTARRDLIGY